MFAGIYSAASAMDFVERKHEAASYNLAHAHLPGFRRWVVDQEPFHPETADNDVRRLDDSRAASGVQQHQRLDLTHGSTQRTGNPLDCTLVGDGYFAVEGPNGPLYTRSGKFHINDQGQLVTVDGLGVRGRSGEIKFSAGSSLNDMRISPTGKVFVGEAEIGDLEIVRIDESAAVTSAGRSLLDVPEESVQVDTDTTVMQGALETSNVQPIEELVTILIGSRQYEAAERVIRSLSELTQRNATSQNGA